MSQDTARTARPSWLNSLMGATLLLIAGLDILMVGFTGWAAWERATYAERLVRMQQEDPKQLPAAQLEMQDLQALIAGSRQVISTTLAAFPTDADVARSMADLRTAAEAEGVTIVELAPQQLPPTSIPTRQFTIRASGEWPALRRFFEHVVQSSLATTRVEQVALQRQGGQAEVSFQLRTTVRPPEPWPLTSPMDPNSQIPWQTP